MSQTARLVVCGFTLTLIASGSASCRRPHRSPAPTRSARHARRPAAGPAWRFRGIHRFPASADADCRASPAPAGAAISSALLMQVASVRARHRNLDDERRADRHLQLVPAPRARSLRRGSRPPSSACHLRVPVVFLEPGRVVGFQGKDNPAHHGRTALMQISDRRDFIQKGLLLAGTAGLMASRSRARRELCADARQDAALRPLRGHVHPSSASRSPGPAARRSRSGSPPMSRSGTTIQRSAPASRPTRPTACPTSSTMPGANTACGSGCGGWPTCWTAPASRPPSR